MENRKNELENKKKKNLTNRIEEKVAGFKNHNNLQKKKKKNYHQINLKKNITNLKMQNTLL